MFMLQHYRWHNLYVFVYHCIENTTMQDGQMCVALAVYAKNPKMGNQQQVPHHHIHQDLRLPAVQILLTITTNDIADR